MARNTTYWRTRSTAATALAVVAVALLARCPAACGQAGPAFDPPPLALAGPSVSEAWSPPVEPAWPSSAWQPTRPASPRVAMSDEPEVAAPEEGETLFAAGPVLEELLPRPDDTPRYVGQPDCCPRPHSYFQRSLTRYGLVAPYPPGVESVHSPPAFGSSGTWLCPPPCDNCPDGYTAGSGTYYSDDFTPDPFYDQLPYNACAEQGIYGDKYLNPVQRPLLECGMPLYLNGPVPAPSLLFGATNPSVPRFYVYGDYRLAAAYNDDVEDKGIVAQRLNLELDFWLTATERFHGFIGPLQRGGDFMRYEFNDGQADYFEELDFFDEDTDTLFFEGDLGAITGGLLGTYAPFDMPIAAGLIPLFFQNGVWVEDAILGGAVTIPARHDAAFDWSNFDLTFFAGVDQVNTPALGNVVEGNIYGVTTFIESKGGYFEVGYAIIEDPTGLDRGYHNIGASYTRRYLNLVSNSIRTVVNTGQDGPKSARTADGALVILENSFLTRWPYNVIPYANLFAGFERPQSAARAGAAGGILRNEGILFESDNLTGFPTLDATANNTYGGALGVDLLGPNFLQQLIVEAAVVEVFGDPVFRNAPGNQYGLGVRYQKALNNAQIIRFDFMRGWLDNADDIAGARVEFRWKF